MFFYKPASIDYRNLKCAEMLDRNKLTPRQQGDLAQGTAAISALWAAAEDDPFWRDPSQWPSGRCILVALCVRDILRAAGRGDATEYRTGMEVRLISGNLPYSLAIGEPNAPYIPNGWNAHMTVRIGDILLDPTHGQTKRHWNNSPYAAAFLFANTFEHRLDINKDMFVRPSAIHYHWYNANRFRTAYFNLSGKADIRTRAWRSAPDALPARREKLVAKALEIFGGAGVAIAS